MTSAITLSRTVRLLLAATVLLAGLSASIGTVAADEPTVTTEDGEPVDLTKLLEKDTEFVIEFLQTETNASYELIQRIVNNGITL